MTEEKAKINEAVNNFYSLKKTYETDYYDTYVKEIVTSKISKKEKKRRFQKLPKPKCINCMRNVGTVFSIKQDAKGITHMYNAHCGDISDPCPLNIQIEMSNIELYSEILSNYNLNKLKKNIILAKNDLLFGYIKEEEAFKLFDDLSSTLKEETATYDYFLEQFISLFDNNETKVQLEKKLVELGISIQNFKDMIKEAKIQNNTQLINNAVEFVIQTMMPLLNEIETIKYPVNRIEQIDGEYHLIQKKNTIENTYFEYEDSKVLSFVSGIKGKQSKTKEAKSKTKTVKVKESTTETIPVILKPKTRKKKPVEFEITNIPVQIEIPEEEENEEAKAKAKAEEEEEEED